MGARIWLGLKSRAAHLRRLSVVFAVELRLKIVTELYMREMGPTQFFREFGGGSPSRVDKNFKKLAKEGWLKYVRSEKPKGKRGPAEKLYRATELAYFDAETWALLPYSIRVAFSWSSFKQIAERMREAMEVLAAEARPTPSITCVQLTLDQLGWERVIEAVDAQFVCVYEEQDDAALRLIHSREKPIRTSVLQFAFESPSPGDERTRPWLAETSKEPPIPFPVRLSKVFADETCLKIILVANQREISAPEFYEEFGGKSIRHIRRRFAKLEEIGWLKRTSRKTEGKRGTATEFFYRAAGPIIADDNGPWADVPDLLAKTEGWRDFDQLSTHVKEAMTEGTFDARVDRYLAWSLLLLDQHGLKKATTVIKALRAFVLKEQDRARARMKKSGERPVTVTVGLGAFESPVESIKEP